MDKILTPWFKYTDDKPAGIYKMLVKLYNSKSYSHIARITKVINTGRCNIYLEEYYTDCNSEEEAKIEIDKILEQRGYQSLTEKQFEKYLLLA